MVLRDDVAYLASRSERSKRPVTAGMADHAHLILERCAAASGDHRAVVVLIDGGKERLQWWACQRDGLADLGWTCTDVQPWTTWHHKDRSTTVHVGFTGDGGIEPRGLFAADDRPDEIARRLAWYADVMGGPWFMTGGVSAHAIIRGLHRKPGKGNQPFWGTRDRRESDDPRTGIGDMIWQRAPRKTELDWGWVHGFDLRAARLASMGVSEVAYGPLRHSGAQAFDRSLAGYWAIRAADVRWAKHAPPIFDMPSVRGGLIWPTTPVMDWLMTRGINPDPVDSWTAPGRRLFRPLAERWDRVRKDGEVHGPWWTVEAVKSTYREGAGLFASPGGSIYRPDWYHTLMDRQRVTVLGHMYRIHAFHKIWPVAVHTDCLYYASPEASPVKAAEALGIRIGLGLGQFRIKDGQTWPIRDFYRRGRP